VSGVEAAEGEDYDGRKVGGMSGAGSCQLKGALNKSNDWMAAIYERSITAHAVRIVAPVSCFRVGT
jgi:multimeric flavodoxin WrbA